MAEMDDLNALVAALPNSALLSPKMKQDALAQAQVPDSLGVWPGRSGYSATYDIYWAATKLIAFLQAQPVVRQSSSEGTSVAVDAPNWSALTQYYLSMSQIAQASPRPLLSSIPIPSGPHVVRTDMSGVDGYGRRQTSNDVNTDLG